MANFGIVVEGIKGVQDVQRLDQQIDLNVVRAVNKVARDTRSASAREITRQLNVPRNYVSEASGRLAVRRKATRAKPEAVITARSRPTSLARFVTGTSGNGTLTLAVKPGSATFLRRAFLIRLRRGQSLTDTQFNQGLAIRLAPGERLSNKLRQVQLSNGLTLLYGPSVQQIFLDNSGRGVADDLSDPAARQLEQEFLRLMDLR